MTEHLGLALIADLIVKTARKLFQFTQSLRGGLREPSHIPHVEEFEELEEHTVITKRTLRRVYRNSGQPNHPPTDVFQTLISQAHRGRSAVARMSTALVRRAQLAPFEAFFKR
jgi:hypothetical protein